MRLAFLLLALVCLAPPAPAQTDCLETVERVMGMLCSEHPPIEGSSRASDVEARAEATVSGVFRRIFGAGVSVGGSSTVEEYSNLLREDIPDAQKMANECRTQMWSVVYRDICQTPENWAPAPAPTPQPDPSPLPPEPDVADPRSRRAVDLIASGRFSEALRIGEEIANTATSPEARAEGHFLAGIAMTSLADQSQDALLADRAIAYFNQAEASGWQAPPEDQGVFLARKAYAHVVAGALRGDVVHLSEAERLSRDALQLVPGHLDANMTLGLAVAAKGALTQSFDQIREGVSLLRLSRAGYAEMGDMASAQVIDSMIYNFCARGVC